MGKQWKQWQTLFWGASKSLHMVTAALKLKDVSPLKENYDHSLLKSRDITLPIKVHLFKATVFPVVTYGYENWTIKKAERWRIDAFELWCWRRLLRLVIAFLPKNKHLLISWLLSPSAVILESKKISENIDFLYIIEVWCSF